MRNFLSKTEILSSIGRLSNDRDSLREENHLSIVRKEFGKELLSIDSTYREKEISDRISLFHFGTIRRRMAMNEELSSMVNTPLISSTNSIVRMTKQKANEEKEENNVSTFDFDDVLLHVEFTWICSLE